MLQLGGDRLGPGGRHGVPCDCLGATFGPSRSDGITVECRVGPGVCILRLQSVTVLTDFGEFGPHDGGAISSRDRESVPDSRETSDHLPVERSWRQLRGRPGRSCAARGCFRVDADDRVDAAPRSAVDDAHEPLAPPSRKKFDGNSPRRGTGKARRLRRPARLFLNRFKFVAEVGLKDVLHVLGEIRQTFLDLRFFRSRFSFR